MPLFFDARPGRRGNLCRSFEVGRGGKGGGSGRGPRADGRLRRHHGRDGVDRDPLGWRVGVNAGLLVAADTLIGIDLAKVVKLRAGRRSSWPPTWPAWRSWSTAGRCGV